MGGVITDATATPEDVINGQIFYNNNERQVGTNPLKKVKKRIYSINKGQHSSTGTLSFKPYSMALLQGAQHDAVYPYSVNNTTYVVDYMRAIRSIESPSNSIIHYALPTASFGNTHSIYMPIKHISGLNILTSNIESIQIGSQKYIIGTSRDITSSVTSDYEESSYVYNTGLTGYWVYNNNEYPEGVCVSFHNVLSPKYPSTVLTSIVISTSCFNWNRYYGTAITLKEPIPIVISTYVD